MDAVKSRWIALPIALLGLSLIKATSPAFAEDWPFPALSQSAALLGKPEAMLVLLAALVAPMPACLALELRGSRSGRRRDGSGTLAVHLAGFAAVQLLAFGVMLLTRGSPREGFLGALGVVLLIGTIALRRLKRREAPPRGDVRRSRLAYLFVALATAAFGVVSVDYGRGHNFDLLNYHLYNAHHLLHDRAGLDFGVAHFEGCFNPVLDVAFYRLVQLTPPAWVGFAMGAAHGMAFVLVTIVAMRVLGAIGWNGPDRVAWALACGVSGVVEPMFLTQLGTTFHDNLTAVLVLASLAVVLGLAGPAAPEGRLGSVALALGSGLLAGLATGLKLTAAPFAIALWAASAIALPRGRCKRWTLAVLALGTATGFLIVHGPWMLVLQQRYQSPLFPFFNQVFRSPYWPETNLGYTVPRSVIEQLTLPFGFAVRGKLASEFVSRDLRLGLVTTLLVLSGSAWLFRRLPMRTRPPRFEGRGPALLLVFVIGSYVLWQWKFGILRYLVPVSLLAPLVCVVLTAVLVRDRRWSRAVSAIGLVAIVSWVLVPNSGRLPWTGRFIPILRAGIGDLEPGAVLISNRQANGEALPIGLAASALPESMRSIHLTSHLLGAPDSADSLKMREEVDAFLGRYDGLLYLMAPRSADPGPIDDNLGRYGLDYARDADGSTSPSASIAMTCVDLLIWRLDRRPDDRTVPAVAGAHPADRR